jgi:hypothetical protein
MAAKKTVVTKKTRATKKSEAQQESGFPKISAPATRALHNAGYTRLEPSGSWNNMVTHRIKISDAKEIDKEVLGYLEQAYNAVQ